MAPHVMRAPMHGAAPHRRSPAPRATRRWRRHQAAARSTRPGTAGAALLRPAALVAACAALLVLAASVASASTAGAAMPWDSALASLLSNFAGRTARALVIIAIVGCGLFWAFTRNEEGLKKLGQIAFGGAIALGAVALVAALGFDAALV